MAQRDAASLTELLHISCFFCWLLPKIEIQLGTDSAVMKSIKEMWSMGWLGKIYIKISTINNNRIMFNFEENHRIF